MSQSEVLSEPWVHACGAGVPAVFVHGIYPGGPDDFAAQQPLGDTFHLLAVDRRGYDGNPDPGGPLGWPVDCDDVVRLLEALGGAHLVGHSYGGVGHHAGVGTNVDDPDRGCRPRWRGPVPGFLGGAGLGDAGGRALVDGLTRRLGAELAVFEHSTHVAASEEPERFNDLLRAVWTR